MTYEKIILDTHHEILLKGSFTYRDHDIFFEIISHIKEAPVRKIVFNLSNCDFVDSAALGMFVIAHDEAANKRVKLAIKGVKGKVKEMMSSARFENLYLFE